MFAYTGGLADSAAHAMCVQSTPLRPCDAECLFEQVATQGATSDAVFDPTRTTSGMRGCITSTVFHDWLWHHVAMYLNQRVCDENMNTVMT